MTKHIDYADLKWRRTKVHFGVILTSTIFLLTILAQSIQFQEMNKRLLELERERVAALESRDRLSLEYESFRSPSRIREIATQKLGMVTPAPSSIRTLESGK